MNTEKFKEAVLKAKAVMQEFKDEIDNDDHSWFFIAKMPGYNDKGEIGVETEVSTLASKASLIEMIQILIKKDDYVRAAILQIGFEEVVNVDPMLAMAVAPILADLKPTIKENGKECDCEACKAKKQFFNSNKKTGPNVN